MTKESICLNCIHQFKIGGCTACSHPDNYDSVKNVLKGRRELIAEYMENGCPLKETNTSIQPECCHYEGEEKDGKVSI